MESLKLVRENVLTFKRLTALNVTGYNIVVKETLPNGSISKYILDTIPNSKVPQPVSHKKILQYTRNQTWQLSDEMYIDSDYSFKVFVNSIKLNDTQYTFSEKLKILTIVHTLTDNDLIEIEYFKDDLLYKHSTSNSCEYFIEPVINYSYNMGDHNIIE